ncbi:hypothetical protein AaE_001584 [Aphanomyces astaci]|uniref:Uncharacterized protein n=1 Tax=Aphanomyces astaci TaxID=112090 RepID=A0A6A5AWT9_APHAT|nr:hypothetical protein AaE_001584 [Aphanomyces astaci]
MSVTPAVSIAHSTMPTGASTLEDFDVYESNPFDDCDVPEDDNNPEPTKSGKQGGAFDFQKWVARKDKYERVLQALRAISTDRAANESQWFECAVALAATDCLLKVGRTDKCDCEGVRPSVHTPTINTTIRFVFSMRNGRFVETRAMPCPSNDRAVNVQRPNAPFATGTITDKMQEIMRLYRGKSHDSDLEIAHQVANMGEGHLLNGVKITGLALRMSKSVLAQCSVLLGPDQAKMQRPCACPMRSLGDHWVHWTKANHSFNKVRLSDAQAKKFGGATRQLMEFVEADNVYLLTIKWRVAAKPQKGDTAKIAARRCLSADEKKLNAVRLCDTSRIVVATWWVVGVQSPVQKVLDASATSSGRVAAREDRSYDQAEP